MVVRAGAAAGPVKALLPMCRFVARDTEPHHVQCMGGLIPAMMVRVDGSGGSATRTLLGTRQGSVADRLQYSGSGSRYLGVFGSVAALAFRGFRPAVLYFLQSPSLLRSSVLLGQAVAGVAILRFRASILAAHQGLALLAPVVLRVDGAPVSFPFFGRESVFQCGHAPIVGRSGAGRGVWKS